MNYDIPVPSTLGLCRPPLDVTSCWVLVYSWFRWAFFDFCVGQDKKTTFGQKDPHFGLTCYVPTVVTPFRWVLEIKVQSDT